MPVMDGYTLCQHCKADEKLKKHPFCLLYSNLHGTEGRKICPGTWCGPFIIKPEEPLTLIQILINLLEEKKKENFVAAKPR